MMLMLVARLDLADDEPTRVLAIRFFEAEEGCVHVKRLAKGQIKKRYPKVEMSDVTWDVYEPRTNRGGWAHWLGEAAWYQ